MEKDSLKGKIDLLLIAGSAGSLDVLLKVLPAIKYNLSFPIIIVLHRKASYDSSLINLFNSKATLPVVEAEEKDSLQNGKIYVAPSDYHLLVETDHSVSLDYSEKIQYSRPCIDVTFETAAEVYKTRIAAILLSGANSDGAAGLKSIKNHGGITAVQNPQYAEVSYMPQKAIQIAPIDYILNIEEIANFINKLSL
ncbi:CheB methylesterase [Arcticibacter svalbardensis MN12-7]|uniref:protein-glutamate methylesterase n=1 Tax=Arcticibacter svalbardensis MN12-7 TaxID=1150600 RepID=R9GWC6_9SPHI|nr:chemotaxis protein CheB [Arcticibacter svalbardensis]EOR96056.1 CheB methylesterase [Arcticibacter svalbardensis MN12-7]